MSLSEICSQQHQHEQQKLRKILLWGILGSVGVHGVGLGLSQLDFWQRLAADDIEPIELVVVEPLPDTPEAIPDPNLPAEISTEVNDSAPGGGAGGNFTAAQVTAPPAPARVAPPVERVESEPEPERNTQADSVVEEPETEPEISETEEPETEPEISEEEPETEPETSETEDLEQEALTAESTESQAENLRDFLQRLRDAQAQTAADSAAAGDGVAGDGNGVATAPSNGSGGSGSGSGTGSGSGSGSGTGSGSGSGSGNGTGSGSGSGSGSGTGQGSRTVACQNCVRPAYPQSALDAGAEGQPMVSVDINPDGSVRSVTLTRSSGNPAIDQAAIQAARNSQFQPVSGGASVPIEYDLTIEGSRRNRDARRRGDRQAVELPPEATPTPETAATEPSPEPTTTPAPPVDAAEPAPTPTPSATSEPEPAEPEPVETEPAEAEPAEPAEPEPAKPEPVEPEPAPASPPPVQSPTPPPAPSAPPAPVPAAPAAPPPAPVAPPSPPPASPPPAAEPAPSAAPTGE
ncbi:TonB family protein [Nodosilinea sp. FACHB-131]|uniref:energy transducer TonB n=1 Tax=Cyanophyceae TaxID=3028117 RepID=UPI00168572A0|nr:energy transducer TonB [Nodosilinea sp. FACHB-131]MBD1874930.1 TonB family protein [Nodosilinea sp. FACHB-131]